MRRCARTAASRNSRLPLVMNRRIENLDANRRWRNFDAFHWVLNHGQ